MVCHAGMFMDASISSLTYTPSKEVCLRCLGAARRGASANETIPPLLLSLPQFRNNGFYSVRECVRVRAP